MNSQDLITLLQNPSVSLTVLRILSDDKANASDLTKLVKSAKEKNEALDKAFGTGGKPRPPKSLDIRGEGRRQASRLLTQVYDWQLDDAIDLWTDMSDSGLRRAFESVGFKISIDNAGKKRSIKLIEDLSTSDREYSYARKKKM